MSTAGERRMVSPLGSDGVKDLLRGFGRVDRMALDRLIEVHDWQRIAREELERRATRIIGSLDDETLQAVASGDLDLSRLCREVAIELAPEAT